MASEDGERQRVRLESAAMIQAAGRINRTGHVGDLPNLVSEFDEYPWIVWQLWLGDPNRLAGDNVAKRTKKLATKVAERYGCVYVGCDDEVGGEINSYAWRIEVKQPQHQTRACELPASDTDVPQVVGELYAALCASLPEALRDADFWDVGPNAWFTLARNDIDGSITRVRPSV